jgi:hypothetical protein
MKIVITDNPQDGNYIWRLYTGPDGIDDYDGLCSSIGECFEEVIKHEVLNAMEYVND